MITHEQTVEAAKLPRRRPLAHRLRLARYEHYAKLQMSTNTDGA